MDATMACIRCANSKSHRTMLAPFCILPDPHVSVIFAE